MIAMLLQLSSSDRQTDKHFERPSCCNFTLYWILRLYNAQSLHSFDY